MLQAVMTQPGVISIREVGRPAIDENQVLIQIKRIGVCGSDIHVYHGLHPYTSYPVVQGHEVSGIIADVGAEVRNVVPGDTVIVMPQVTCGQCYPCRHSMYHICDHLKVMGFQAPGAAQEFFAVNAEMVLRVPESVSLDHAAMIEPIAVAVHALARAGNVQGKYVVVLGAGTIGNLVGQVARAEGAADVLITDLSAYRLNKARECHLDHVVDTQTNDLGEAIGDAFGADKADMILDCVGAEQTMSQAIACARKGSTIVVVGVFGQKPVVDMGLIQDHELTVTGTLMYQKRDFEQALALIEHRKLYLDSVVTHRFAFRDYLEAYKTIEASHGQSLKVLIEL
jgi:L-iditol 2-dehydrogenase